MRNLNIIECRSVNVTLNGSHILRDVDLVIRSGEFVGLIGPNGAGKSTLARIVAGISQPNSGTVMLNGQKLALMSRQEIAKTLAVVAQEENLEFGFSVLDYVTLGRAPYHGGLFFENYLDRDVVQSALLRTETGHLAERQIESLSGGEKQRVRIARALAQQPDILILDEPTNHLDLYSQMGLIELLKEINSQGITILMISHDINFMCLSCPHLKLMSQGRIISEGPSENVIKESSLARAFKVKVHVDKNPVTQTPRITPIQKL
ncbi:MAG: ABC transporter ATP-binding protein [Desulfomonilaceae bacterium]